MSDYGPGPHVAVDFVVDALVDNKTTAKTYSLLIKRMDGTWALPGGFVDPEDESLEAAAVREVLEETGLNLYDPEFVKNRRNRRAQIYSLQPMTNKNRDPRSWVISFPFRACLGTFPSEDALPKITAGDDAKEVHWVHILKVAQIDNWFLDHRKIWDSIY